MGNLADYIEQYIKQLLDDAMGHVEIRRKDVADRFQCVPSQVTYVLSTRFTLERGYVVETRRGGGGYVRIFRIHSGATGDIAEKVVSSIGDEIDERRGLGLLDRLTDMGLLSDRTKVMIAAMLRRETEGLPPEMAGMVRAKLLKALVLMALSGR